MSGSCRRWRRCTATAAATCAATRRPGSRFGRRPSPAASPMRASPGCRRSSASTPRPSRGWPTGWRGRSGRRRSARPRRARSSRRPRSRRWPTATSLARRRWRRARARGRGDPAPGLGAAARVPRRPALAPGARRVHRGDLAGDHRGAASESARRLTGVDDPHVPDDARRARRAAGARRSRLARDRGRRARRAPGAAPAAPARGRASCSSSGRRRCSSALLGLQDTVRVVGDVPSGLPAPLLPSSRHEDVETARAAGGRHRADRLRRDRGDRADVREPAPVSPRAARRVPGARRREPRRRGVPGLSRERELRPDRAVRRGGRPDGRRLADHEGRDPRDAARADAAVRRPAVPGARRRSSSPRSLSFIDVPAFRRLLAFPARRAAVGRADRAAGPAPARILVGAGHVRRHAAVRDPQRHPRRRARDAARACCTGSRAHA